MQEQSQEPSLKSFSLYAYLTERSTAAVANQMVTVAVGWQIYALTKSTFYLGLVGLMQFIPMILMTVFAGFAADHFNRKIIISLCDGAQCLCLLTLFITSRAGIISTGFILLAAFVIGGVNALHGPSMQSLLPGIVARSVFPRAAAVNASCFQIATIVGPAVGGLLYAFGPDVVYLMAAVFMIVASFSILFVKAAARDVSKTQASLKTMLAGFSYIKGRPVILGAISLDLFAVLFGGATALLPVYASTILHVGSFGLGLLRSAPAAGAFIVSFLLSRRPVTSKVGIKMFVAVIIFGLATIVFAVSRIFVISLAALLILGSADIVSVVIRATLVQLQTPDEMRGRVSSVNQIFIGTSNQLGEFESGLTATWFGAQPAAVIGGIGTICVVFLWMAIFPQLRKANTFDQKLD